MKWIIALILFIAFIISTLGLLVNEKFGLLFAVDIGIVIIGIIVFNALSNSSTKKKAKAEGASDAFVCDHVEGIGIGKGAPCELRNYPEKIEIKDIRSQRSFTIPHDRIRALESKKEQEFIDLDRSVVGRAIVGNLLVPGIGGIVGGMSGLKNKKKGKMRTFLIINYLDKDNELKGITFENSFNVLRMNAFIQGVNKVSNTQNATVEL